MPGVPVLPNSQAWIKCLPPRGMSVPLDLWQRRCTAIVFSFRKRLNYLNLSYFPTNITTVSTCKRNHQRSSNSKALVTHWNTCKLANNNPQKSVTIFSVSFELANANVSCCLVPRVSGRTEMSPLLSYRVSGESPPNLLLRQLSARSLEALNAVTSGFCPP